MAIDSFRDKYRFLSNFAPATIEYEGRTYLTLEHAFQAAKTDDMIWKEQIRTAENAGAAKRYGRAAPKRADWDSVRVDIMRELLALKFAEGSTYANMLLATGIEELVEGNWWGDTFWGVCGGVGQNWLGRLLMERREQLRPLHWDLGDWLK